MKKVWKKNRKPFKSGKKINTVKEIVTNPHTNLPAYSFEEDESLVDVRTCEDVPKEYLILHKKLTNINRNTI